MPLGAKEPNRDYLDRFGWVAIAACDSPQKGVSSYERSPDLP